MISIPLSKMALTGNNNTVVVSPSRRLSNPGPSGSTIYPPIQRQSPMAENYPLNRTNFQKPVKPIPIVPKPNGQRFASPPTNALNNTPSRLTNPQTYRVVERETQSRIPRPNQSHLVYQQHARQGFIPVEPTMGSDEEQWRTQCEKLKRENHDLNKVG